MEREYSLLRVVKVNKGLSTQKGKTRNIGGNCSLIEKIPTLSTPFWLPESSLSLSSCYLKRTAAASQQAGGRASELERQWQMPFNHVIPGWFSGSWPKHSDPLRASPSLAPSSSYWLLLRSLPARWVRPRPTCLIIRMLIHIKKFINYVLQGFTLVSWKGVN